MNGFDIAKLTVIDDGEYQGTEIYIIPQNIYQPDLENYIYTNTYYGSCSGCDTLQSIHRYENGLPDKEQIKDYMNLALHLLQKSRWFKEEEE